MNNVFKQCLLSLVVLALPHVASAQTIALCQDDLAVDRQPSFATAAASLALGAVSLTGSGDLRLNTGLAALNPEQIILPFAQTLSISFVTETAGASQTLGWFYYDDLIAKGYINTNGTPTDSSDDTLRDTDSDGIPDFHADIYNMGYTRPYVGTARRCTTTFTHSGKTYFMPEVAVKTCAGYFGAEALEDDLPPYTSASRDVVGMLSPASPYTAPGNEFSDNGLYAQVPNLLEPRHPSNGLKGIAHLVFLNGDDDTDTDSYGAGQRFTPAPDVVATTDDGIPDYNVTAYNSDGVPLGTPPDLVINGADRTVNLGLLQANREIVFFILNYGDKKQEPTRAVASGGPRVLPCLREASGHCALHLRTPVAVYFSKAALNMDFNPLTANPAAERNIGCGYPAFCATVSPPGSFQGWLDPAGITRLNTSTYGNLAMPMEYISVPRPANNRMPHVVVGAPSTNPFRWILGFENVAGGGDRDFNDIIFLINKSNGGGVTSGVVSGDISPGIAPDFTITQIRFERTDDVTRGLPGPPAWFEVTPGACAAAPPPAINYFLSVDCRICTLGVCTPNPTPTWFPVVFPPATPNVAVINPLDYGATGSQLCWRAAFVSPNEFCQPTINDINVGYQAVKSGNYSRASASPIANAVVYGAQEMPGLTWTGPASSPTPAPTTRLYDDKKDFSPRGHLHLTTLYEPEATGADLITPRWEAGEVFTQAAFNPTARTAYTLDSTGLRLNLNAAANLATLFPLPTSCLPTAPPHDLNADALCDSNDAVFIRDWLLGWEDKASSVKRAWTFGGLNYSTPAFVGPPGQPAWLSRAAPTEQVDFKNNFASLLRDRRAQTYVGSVSGVIHAFDSGLLRLGDDACTSTSAEYRGYFEHTPSASCGTTRDYGLGTETFAYFPRLLLGRYVNNFTGFIPSVSGPRATVDASPTVMDVDLDGLASAPAWTIDRTPGLGAKTVLVTASGKGSPGITALDVTNDPTAPAGTYPIPLWEFDLGTFANTFNTATPTPPVLLDGLGSRHAPFIGRFEVRTSSGLATRWLAVVGTDFKPTPSSAGTVYFIDVATGRPLNLATLPTVKPAVVPLEANEGVAGEPMPVDLDGNSTYDTVYIPSTSGKVWRISLKETDLSAPAGQEILRCAMADAHQVLEVAGPTEPFGTQRIYSNLAVKVIGTLSSAKVQFFFGTADDPDDPTDLMSTHYYVLGFEDPAPMSSSCNTSTVLWYKQLELDQRVWGGVSVNNDNVFIATAVGSAADACNLDPVVSGKLYSVPQANTSVPVPATSGTNLGGHATSTPVMYDNHVFVSRINGGPRVLGDSTHNNPVGGAVLPRSRVLMWDSAMDGKLPQ